MQPLSFTQYDGSIDQDLENTHPYGSDEDYAQMIKEEQDIKDELSLSNDPEFIDYLELIAQNQADADADFYAL